MKASDLLYVKILKGVGIAVLVFLAVFVYSFMGSKIGGDDRDSAAAYGYDSLEYTAEPVMQINVWQRNDKKWSDYPDKNAYSSFFYNVLPLKLAEGETVSTNEIPLQWNNPFVEDDDYSRAHLGIVLTVTYDGTISGEFDRIRNLKYSADTTSIPNALGNNTNGVVDSADGTFTRVDQLMLSFSNETDQLCELESRILTEDSRRQIQQRLQDAAFSRNLDYDDYTYFQKYTDAFPDADEKWEKVERAVLTSYVTINAMDPVRTDVVTATAVLELTSYSRWLVENISDSLREEFFSSGNEDHPHSTVTVVSYEQSDTFAME